MNISKNIKTKSRSIAYFLLSAMMLGSFFLYHKSLNDKITALLKSNKALKTKNDSTLKKLQGKLKASEKKVHTLEKILEKRMMQTVSWNSNHTETVKKHYYMKKVKVRIKTFDPKERKGLTQREDLERQLAAIFAKNKTPQTLNMHPKKIQRLISTLAKDELGKKYVWGAIGPNTYDCSGLTYTVYKKLGISLPRVSREQAKHGIHVKRENLKTGDLIFFDTSKEKKGVINHVGIYLGDNHFIHASSASKSVVVTSLNKPFYHQSYKWARRVTGS